MLFLKIVAALLVAKAVEILTLALIETRATDRIWSEFAKINRPRTDSHV